MKETTAATARPPQPAAAISGTGTKYRFHVRYYRRMRLQHVYPVTVSARSVDAGTRTGAPVTLRAVIPGALVTPAELALDVSDPKAAATFYVTPLARCRLPDARIEVHSHGSPLQRIPLAMRATTQRLTWILAFLTLAVPAFLLYTTVYYKLEGQVPRSTGRPVLDVRADPDAEPAKDPRKEDPKPPGPNPAPGQQPITQGPALDPLLQGLIGLPTAGSGDVQKEGKAPKKEEDPTPVKPDEEKKDAESIAAPKLKAPSEEKKAEAAGGGPPAKGPGKKGGKQPRVVDVPPVADEGAVGPVGAVRGYSPMTRAGRPGELLELRILEHVPDVPWALREKVTWFPLITAHVAWALGGLYDLAVAMAYDRLSFYVGVVLLGLTVASLVTHRGARGRRTGAPVVVPP